MYQNLTSRAETVVEPSISLTSALVAAGVKAWALPLNVDVGPRMTAELLKGDPTKAMSVPTHGEAQKLRQLLLSESMAVTKLNKVLNSWSWFGRSRVQLPAGLGLCQSRENLRRVVEQLKKQHPDGKFTEEALAKLGYRKSGEGQTSLSSLAKSPLTSDVFEKYLEQFLSALDNPVIDASGFSGKSPASSTFLDPKNFTMQKRLFWSRYKVKDAALDALMAQTTASDVSKSTFRALASRGQNENLRAELNSEAKHVISLLAKEIRRHSEEIAFVNHIGQFMDKPPQVLQMAYDSGFVKSSRLRRVLTWRYTEALSDLTSIADWVKSGYFRNSKNENDVKLKEMFAHFHNLTSLLARHVQCLPPSSDLSAVREETPSAPPCEETLYPPSAPPSEERLYPRLSED